MRSDALKFNFNRTANCFIFTILKELPIVIPSKRNDTSMEKVKLTFEKANVCNFSIPVNKNKDTISFLYFYKCLKITAMEMGIPTIKFSFKQLYFYDFIQNLPIYNQTLVSLYDSLNNTLIAQVNLTVFEDVNEPFIPQLLEEEITDYSASPLNFTNPNQFITLKQNEFMFVGFQINNVTLENYTTQLSSQHIYLQMNSHEVPQHGKICYETSCVVQYSNFKS
jgi:hypothetical protein